MNNKNIDWFKDNLSKKFDNYELTYKYLEEGDFGTLNQVEFNSERIDGAIDFWSQGWIGIYAWDNKGEKELINVLSEPEEKDKAEKAFNDLLEVI